MTESELRAIFSDEEIANLAEFWLMIDQMEFTNIQEEAEHVIRIAVPKLIELGILEDAGCDANGEPIRRLTAKGRAWAEMK
jgi:hypothetical protein